MEKLRDALCDLAEDVSGEYREALFCPAFQNLPKEAYRLYSEALSYYVEYCESLSMAIEACRSAEEGEDTTEL